MPTVSIPFDDPDNTALLDLLDLISTTRPGLFTHTLHLVITADSPSTLDFLSRLANFDPPPAEPLPTVSTETPTPAETGNMLVPPNYWLTCANCGRPVEQLHFRLGGPGLCDSCCYTPAVSTETPTPTDDPGPAWQYDHDTQTWRSITPAEVAANCFELAPTPAPLKTCLGCGGQRQQLRPGSLCRKCYALQEAGKPLPNQDPKACASCHRTTGSLRPNGLCAACNLRQLGDTGLDHATQARVDAVVANAKAQPASTPAGLDLSGANRKTARRLVAVKKF